MKIRYFIPLFAFVIPTLVIGFGVVIPGSCIAGVNKQTMGFVSSVVAASVTYWLGIRAVVRDQRTK